MHSAHLHEHDAHEGAKSSGEFLGMTGNSGWLLLGSCGVTILMVVFLWGMLGVSLLFCLLVGVVLCGLSLAYVFGLKNNRPAHYDSDFFESALVEAGLVDFQFGPRTRSPANPFRSDAVLARATERSVRTNTSAAPRQVAHAPRGNFTAPVGQVAADVSERRRKKEESVVARAAFEQVVERLAETEALLEETMAESAEARL